MNDTATAGRFPDLSPEEMEAQLHAIDESGQVWRGAGAIRQALVRQRGLLRHAGGLWRLPGFTAIAERAYRLLAAVRRRDPA